MLEFSYVTKSFGGGPKVLDGLDMKIVEGEILALLGGSGCGKSTLLRLAAGLDRPDGGEIRVNGRAVERPVAEIGMVFQEPRLLPWLTVAQNIGFGLNDWPTARREAQVAKLLGEIGLPDYGPRWPKELSGGQAQRVAIARALAPEPRVLLLDEPFSALDALTRAELQDHLRKLWRLHRRTFVIVTHDIEEATALAHRVVVMRARPGRIAEDLTIDLPDPRERASAEFSEAERAVRRALGRALAKIPA